MKLRKWLAMVLAVVMAIGTFGALVGCKPEEKPKDPSNPSTPSNPSDSDDDDTSIQYYLCGLGLGTLEASNNWDNTSTDESLKFTRTGNTATITADLYEGDEFGIIHNQAWDGQMGMNIVANGGKATDETVIFEAGGGYDVKNIKVAAGQSGKYKLTLTLNSESDFGTNTLTWERLEKYDVVFVTWIDVDGETELAKTVVKKNTAATSRIYDVSKRFYEFDKWVTKDGDTETAFDFTKNLTESVSLYATIKESANAAYVEDTSEWQIRPVGGTAINFERDPDYKQHNVFVATYEMADGAEFSITNGTIPNAQITGLESSRLFKYTAEKYKTNTGAGGNYKFTIITEKTATELKVSALYAEAIAPTFTGYAIIGSFADASWSYVEGVNPKMVETSTKGTFTATLVVDTATEAEPFEFKVAKVEKNNVTWNPEWNNNGGNYEIKAPGTYTVTVKEGETSITVTAAETDYYLVGTFVDSTGTTQNFVYVDGLTPKLTKGTDGKYTIEYNFPDVHESFEWLKGGVFAFKVVSVVGGEIKDWYSWAENNDNGLIPAAGTYIVTLDPTAGTFTFAAKN